MHLRGAVAPAPGQLWREFTEGKGECNAADIDVQYLNEIESKGYFETQNLWLIMDQTDNRMRTLSRVRPATLIARHSPL